jgi:hypothetical protein
LRNRLPLRELEGALLVAATDLNVSLTAELKSHNAAEGGLTLGAKALYELIANAPGDEITLKRADNHWAEIKRAKVSCAPAGQLTGLRAGWVRPGDLRLPPSCPDQSVQR